MNQKCQAPGCGQRIEGRGFYRGGKWWCENCANPPTEPKAVPNMMGLTRKANPMPRTGLTTLPMRR